MTKQRFNLKTAWIVGVVGYAILRAVIAWGLFRDYGVNPWVFAVIDIGTAIPYATAVAELPGAIARSERRGIIRRLVVAVVTFMAPYAYIWLAAEDAPTDLRGGLLVLVVCLFGAAGIGVWRKSRAAEVIDLEPRLAQNGSSSMSRA